MERYHGRLITSKTRFDSWAPNTFSKSSIICIGVLYCFHCLGSCFGRYDQSKYVRVAQLVEHGTHKPGVVSSILTPDTTIVELLTFPIKGIAYKYGACWKIWMLLTRLPNRCSMGEVLCQLLVPRVVRGRVPARRIDRGSRPGPQGAHGPSSGTPTRCTVSRAIARSRVRGAARAVNGQDVLWR